MLQFIKILDNSKGVTFNGDAPFIHWFEGPRSVNLWHYHRLLILGPVQFDVKFADNSLFTFYKPGSEPNEIDGFDWDDISKCTTKYLTSTGVSHGDKYIHQLIILAKGSGEGEYIDTMTASSDGCEHKYNIGIELFNENEQLGINLANMGIEIPDAIVKALYSSDLFEDYTDWVLINRKWRELLSNYMDIWGCKGSYKSLINSLKWFEYGDLVELREVWKHGTNGGTKLADKPISQWLTEKLAQESLYSAKTTYFALRHLSVDLNAVPEMIPENPYNVDDKDNVLIVPSYPDKVYDCNYPAKCDHDICSKWGKEELRMKMTLLGSFFETYFMPVHLDLIRSVIEDVYFNVSAILVHGAYETIHTQDSSNVNDFEIKIGDDIWDSSSVVDLGTFDLDMVTVWGNSDTAVPFSSVDGPIVGVTLDPPAVTAVVNENNDVEPDDPVAYMNIFQQNYMGIGSVIPMTIRLPEPISEGYVETNINGYHQRVELGNADWEEVNDMYVLSMNFLVQLDGEYYVFFNLVGKSDNGFYNTYTKQVNFVVQDNTNAVLTFFKLVFDPDKLQKNPFAYESLGEQLNMFTSEHEAVSFTSTQAETCADEDDSYPIYEYNGETIPASKISSFSYKQYIPIYNWEGIMEYDQPRKLPLYVFHGDPVTFDIINEKFNELGIGISVPENAEEADKIDALISTIEKESSLNCWCRVAVDDNAEDGTGKIQYIQLIGKEVVVNESAPAFIGLSNSFQTHFERQVYIPEFHNLVRVTQADEVPDIYPVICTPIMCINSENGTKKLIWTNNMSEPAWTFKSENYQTILNQLNDNIIEPFIANPYAGMESPHGYYTITLKYRWGNNIKTIVSKSPFISQYGAENPDYREYKSYYILSEMPELGSTAIIESDDKKIYFKI